MNINITHITNYNNYFDKDNVSKKYIYNVIKDFQKYYNDKKIEMLYIHLDKEYDIDDAIKEFRQYYEKIKVNEFIKEFNDNSKNKKIKLDNISNLLIDFNEFYKNQKVNKKNYS